MDGFRITVCANVINPFQCRTNGHDQNKVVRLTEQTHTLTRVKMLTSKQSVLTSDLGSFNMASILSKRAAKLSSEDIFAVKLSSTPALAVIKIWLLAL